MSHYANLYAYLKKKYSSNSIQGYYNQIKRYLLFQSDRSETATEKDILEYIRLLRGQGLHPKSLRNNLFAIKIYYQYLVESGKRLDHPCKYLYLKDQINKQIQVDSLYSKEVLENLFTSWQSKSPKYQQRDKVIVSLLVCQALTTQEIVQLKTSDINLEQGILAIHSAGQNRARTLSLKPTQILLFCTYLAERKIIQENNPTIHFLLSKEQKPLWSGAINRVVNQNRKSDEKLLPLKIRQSVIAHLLKAGNDIRIVQTFAGHKRASSTENYKQSGLEELKAIIDKLHPLQ